VPLPRFNAELRESAVWRNVGIRGKDNRVWYLHAALLLGYCALEAHVNNVAADFADRPELTVLEQSILQNGM
jgi:hypothetical protein